MFGVDQKTGEPLQGDKRIVQSIRRLVMTDGDLIMRRHLKCSLPDAVGAPNNALTALAYCAAVAGAVTQGEPRCELKVIRFLGAGEVPQAGNENLGAQNSADGQSWLYIDATSTETGEQIELTELVQ